MTDFTSNEHVCDKCGLEHKHDWETQQKQMTDLYGCANSTVDDYHRYYQKYPYVRARDQAMTFRALADKYYDGNVMVAILADMAISLGGWSAGMQKHGEQVAEIVAMAKKDRGDGEDWQGNCDCDK